MILRRALLAGVALLAALAPAKADFTFTLGTGATGFSFTSTTGGTALCAAASTHCFASVPINTAGAQLFTSGVPGVVNATQWASVALGAPSTYGTSPGAVNVPGVNAYVTNATAPGQAVMAASSPVVIASNQSSIPVTATLNAETTKVLGTVRMQGNVGGVLDAVIGAAAPANSMALASLGSGATNGLLARNITCDNYVFKHITSATDTLAVQGVASQTVYVCGFHARAAGVATWFLENTNNTNANCGGTLTQISIVNTEAANTGIVDRSAFWSGLKNTSGNGLCINSTGTGGVDVGIYYAQF